MNYKLIKIGYLTLAAFIILLSFGTIIFIDNVLEVISTQTMIIISACLCLPFFILKFLYEQKYPPTQKDKTISVILAVILMIFIFMV